MISLLRKVWAFVKPTIHYWMETEVHVYAFSIAANVLLSFFPFLVVIMSICKNGLHWHGAVDAINIALQDYFPGSVADFVQRNLTVPKSMEWLSMLLLLFTANGVFEPLEVALNRAWGITKNRSFVKNQLISYGLIFACGTLALISTTITALNPLVIRTIGITNADFAAFVAAAIFKGVAVPLVMLALFLVYWKLPNGDVPRDRIVIAAIGVGLLLEVLKYVQLLVWPWMFQKLQREYGPFRISVSLIFIAFFASMLVLAGAEWASRPSRELALKAGEVDEDDPSMLRVAKGPAKDSVNAPAKVPAKPAASVEKPAAAQEQGA